MKVKQECEVGVSAIKARLVDYKETEREIDGQIERLERLQSKMTSAGVQALTDMPRNPSASTDRMADMLSRKEKLDETIRSAIEHQTKEREYFESVLRMIKKSDERLVIRSRYFDCEGWSDVTDLLFGGKADYLDRQDSYLRRTHQIHGQSSTKLVW